MASMSLTAAKELPDLASSSPGLASALGGSTARTRTERWWRGAAEVGELSEIFFFEVNVEVEKQMNERKESCAFSFLKTGLRVQSGSESS